MIKPIECQRRDAIRNLLLHFVHPLSGRVWQQFAARPREQGEPAGRELLLRRAAEAGGAAAALSLGETFDPLIIQRFDAIGVQPDAAKAREWYERR